MSKSLIAGVLASLVAGVVAFALFYTPEGRWAQGTMGGPPLAAPSLSVALADCLKAHDPHSLPAFTRSGVYRMSGWFLPPQRHASVNQCMERQGWLYMPLHLYSP